MRRRSSRWLGGVASASLIGAVFVACGEAPTDLPVEPEVDVSLSTSDAEPPERPAPVDLSGEHNSHYTDAGVIDALSRSSSTTPVISGVSYFGGHLQVATRAAGFLGFPTDGADYLVVSSGDATDPSTNSDGAFGSAGSGCFSDSDYGTLCDRGGIEISVDVPAGGAVLEFDLKYFSWDLPAFSDPARVYLRVAATETTVERYDVVTESPGKTCPPFPNPFFCLTYGSLRQVSIDLSAYGGQTVVVGIEATDAAGFLGFEYQIDSGVLVDNFGFVNGSPNQPPTADPNGPYLVAADSVLSVDGSGSSDPDGDALTYDWDWGDGNAGATPSHSYADAGIYDVCLTVTDTGGLSDTACTLAVVYDPSAGFVTGGGWIDSPAGAYKPDDTLTGRANFGFVAKYKKGQTTPDGNTEFQFKAADLNFHSSDYEFLVITNAGSNALIKGVGAINGMGDYGFMLWAMDGSTDAFRIRIWSEDELGNETDVYDNGFDQAIGGGSIVIHEK